MISNTSRPSSPALAPCVANVVIPGTSPDSSHDEGTEVLIYFRTPARHTERGW